MIISKEDMIKLNYLAHGNGAEAIEYLGKLLWDYYANETVYCTPDQKNKNSGAAQLADWLRKLPKGLQDGRQQ